MPQSPRSSRPNSPPTPAAAAPFSLPPTPRAHAPTPPPSPSLRSRSAAAPNPIPTATIDDPHRTRGRGRPKIEPMPRAAPKIRRQPHANQDIDLDRAGALHRRGLGWPASHVDVLLPPAPGNALGLRSQPHRHSHMYFSSPFSLSWSSPLCSLSPPFGLDSLDSLLLGGALSGICVEMARVLAARGARHPRRRSLLEPHPRRDHAPGHNFAADFADRGLPLNILLLLTLVWPRSSTKTTQPCVYAGDGDFRLLVMGGAVVGRAVSSSNYHARVSCLLLIN
nr:uncharacterized protein LOC109782006 isoform X2 [Aegilops tauschii subsp. strangulata]